MELRSDIVNSSSLRKDKIKSCCKPTYRRSWPKNKGALLVLIWNFLCFSVYQYFNTSNSRDPIIKKNEIFQAELLAMGLLLPIGGWLADAYFGRYRVIRFGMWTMWFGAMMNGFSLVIGKAFLIYGSHGDPWVSFACRVIMGAGLGAFQANIIQFGIDQLMDAPSTEIKSFISWYTMSVFGISITLYFSSYCAPAYVAVLVVAVCLTLAVISTFFLNHWLIKEQIISNPLPLVVKVVHFVIKNKCQRRIPPEQQGLLSNFNIAKRVYNGPFPSEQVEDVKTFFRVLVVIVIFIIAFSGQPTVNGVSFKIVEHLRNWPNSTIIEGCYQRLSVFRVDHTSVLVAVLLYEIFIYPLFQNFLPSISITTKFSISVVLYFASIMALLTIETVSYRQQIEPNHVMVRCIFQSEHTVDINFCWAIVPFVLQGFSSFLFITSAIEFICAQAPFNMKGLILGIGCALYGLSSLIQAGMSIPFTQSNIWERAPLTCSIWYLILQGFIVLVGFLVALLTVITYKRRTRISVSTQDDRQESDLYEE